MPAIWTRINTLLLALVLLALLGVLAMLATGVRGGPLDPPGPVGPTGKNVITSLPTTISQPGSYVLTSNLTCTTCTSGQHGITVNADNVTIDLQGFELVGVPGSGNGIFSPTSGGGTNLTVRNGIIRSWSLAGVKSEKDVLVVEDTTLRFNLQYGIFASFSARVVGCLVQGPGAGLSTTGINVGARSVVSGCSVWNNGDTEIAAGAYALVEDCIADGTGTMGAGIGVGPMSVVRGCTAANNLDTGILALAGNSSIEGNHVVNNGGNGYFGIWAQGGNNIIDANRITANSGDGIKVEGANNTIRNNEIVRVLPKVDIRLGATATGTVLRDNSFTAQSNCILVEPGASFQVFDNSWHDGGSC